ncbi:PIN domain-containing protein [Bacillus alveayuensis]|uniref:PIN domain-containing protein n=1 Tax=Aeribacillus alveayuensis TaxID=279215 RepID=UPI00190FE8A4
METEEKSVFNKRFRITGRNVDFIDAYIAAHAKANPSKDVVTLDKHFKRLYVS